MGCKQSKEAAVVTAAAASNPSASASASAAPSNISNQISPTSTASSSSPLSSKKSSSRFKSSPPPHPGALYYHLLCGLNPYNNDDTANNSSATTTPIIVKAQSASFWEEAHRICLLHPTLASYIDPSTLGTPLHVASSLGSTHVVVNINTYSSSTPSNSKLNSSKLLLCDTAIRAIAAIISACPKAVHHKDKNLHVPLEGIFAGMWSEKRKITSGGRGTAGLSSSSSIFRYKCTKLLLDEQTHNSNVTGVLLRGKRLYSIVESLIDDIDTPLGPTVEYMKLLVEKGGATVQPLPLKSPSQQQDEIPSMKDENDADDDVLALLYRRFVRQFDQSERFFEGDNSRLEVTQHRQRYKNAAVNTFNIIELLLRRPKTMMYNNNNNNHQRGGDDEEDYLVHNAVRSGTCPPDLLRYIVETNLDAVSIQDARGNLPLHYAAGYDDVAVAAASPSSSTASPIMSATTSTEIKKSTTPESYSKYVIDELLYAYPDGASVPNAANVLPIVLAIESRKKWIGGGIRSLHEAYPPGIEMANLGDEHPLLHAMSFASQDGEESVDMSILAAGVVEPDDNGQGDDLGRIASGVDGGGGRRRKRQRRRKINKDESHDAIMFVQRPDAAVRDVVTVMWANEEDGGVQMLGCSALEAAARGGGGARKGSGTNEVEDIASVALLGVTTVVNAMKNHPNEPVVQEKACSALYAMTPADGVREVSFAASGAISTVVSAMQAHVSDATVQKEACKALRGIAAKGGPERATVVASVSGFTALINSLAAHPNDRDVQREACGALDVFTSYHDAAYLPKLHEQTETLLRLAATNFPEDCSESANAILSRMK